MRDSCKMLFRLKFRPSRACPLLTLCVWAALSLPTAFPESYIQRPTMADGQDALVRGTRCGLALEERRAAVNYAPRVFPYVGRAWSFASDLKEWAHEVQDLYLDHSLAVDGSFEERIFEGRSVVLPVWSNDAVFLASCGLPADFYLSSGSPRSVGGAYGWQGIGVVLSNLRWTARSAEPCLPECVREVTWFGDGNPAYSNRQSRVVDRAILDFSTCPCNHRRYVRVFRLSGEEEDEVEVVASGNIGEEPTYPGEVRLFEFSQIVFPNVHAIYYRKAARAPIKASGLCSDLSRAVDFYAAFSASLIAVTNGTGTDWFSGSSVGFNNLSSEGYYDAGGSAGASNAEFFAVSVQHLPVTAGSAVTSQPINVIDAAADDFGDPDPYSPDFWDWKGHAYAGGVAVIKWVFTQ